MDTELSNCLLHHKDGSLWATGQKRGEIMVGYWEWFRKDGTKMRSGTFDDAGVQIGVWTTYDQTGAAHKVTTIKPNTDSKAISINRSS